MSSGRIDFGEYLQVLRTTNGYSQKKVADRIGIDISLLSKIEHGERQLQSHMIAPIADLFEIDYSQFKSNLSIRKSYRNLETNHI